MRVRIREIKANKRAKTLIGKRSLGSFIGILAVLSFGWWAFGLGTFKRGGDLWQGAAILIGGIVLGVIIIATPRERYREIFANHFGWIPVSIGAVSYWYWKWYGGADVVDSSFFDTAAQVLPILLLAAVVDVRRSMILKSSQLALPMIAIFLGEMTALNESAFSSRMTRYGSVNSDFAVVSASLVIAIVALFMAILADLQTDE
jgi:hypothetical protein